ncbi:MAG: magnesium/cobalt transporter CorA [Cyanobacteria bacterium]|nr:magnesium/cobalt transporter CorA [Cyanobacteriota bacterium]
MAHPRSHRSSRSKLSGSRSLRPLSPTKPEYFHESIGSIPGTLNIRPESAPPEIDILDYVSDSCEDRTGVTPLEIKVYLEHSSITWIDLKGLGHEETLRQVGEVFQLHPLLLEDIVNVPQRPKVQDSAKQLLIIARMVVLTGTLDENSLHSAFITEQVSFVVGSNYVLTVQEEPDYDCFEIVRSRLRDGRGTIRKKGADYLMYALLDSIVDGFFPVLEAYGEALELLEDEVVANPTVHTLEKIHQMKRDLITLRRAIWPQRDAINSLIRDENPLIGDEVRLHLRDCYDHSVQVMDMVETYREVASSLMDVYLSSVSNRMNEIMKFLTVISSIFIPLTFIAGVYGMNFNTEKSRFNMPELNEPYGYVICLGLMAIVAVGMVTFFWRKGWFSSYAMQPRSKSYDRSRRNSS